MAKKHWFFPAMACIPLAMLGEADVVSVGIILYGLWFIRILLLNHQETLKITLIISVLFGGALFFHKATNQTCLQPESERFFVFPEVTSIHVNGDRLRFRGQVQAAEKKETVMVNYRLETEAEKEKWLKEPPTGFLLIEGELKEPTEPSNFNQFDYRKHLKRQNIHWQLQAQSFKQAENKALKPPKFHFVESIRLHIFDSIDKTFSPNIASYLKILLFADKRYLSEEVLQNYRAIGVVHLFSISGFHIAYLAHAVRRFLLRLGFTHESTNKIVLSVLPLYGLLVGFGVSVFRAVFQTSFLLIGKKSQKSISTLDAWSLTMLVALFLNPYQVFSVSFQLSYLLSGLFIVMGGHPGLTELSATTSAFLFSLVSSLASMPVLAYHFFEISWLALFANLLFIPLFTYLLFPSLLLLFLCSLFLKKAALFNLCNHFLEAAIGMLESGLVFLNKQIDFSFVIGRLPNLVQLLMIGCIFNMFIKIEQRKLPSVLSVGLLLGSLFYHQLSPAGYVLMLDVGQGDSILIKEPQTGKVSMIDTGGSLEWFSKAPWQEQEDPFTIGKNITLPALKSLGISQIDRLYLTHADIDHVGEIETIGKWLPIKEIVATEATLKDKIVVQQINTLKNTKLTAIDPPVALNDSALVTLVLFPVDAQDSTNDDSLTLYVKIGKDTWLFTGDLENDGERQLINHYPNLKTDYLKIGHHGSKTSTSKALLDQIEAKHALISAGRNNTYGHPHPEVVQRLAERDIPVFTTADEGAIMIRYLKPPFINDWLKRIKTAYEN